MSNQTVENKVLEFPESKSVRKRLMDRNQDQKAVLGLSIVSVLVVSVFLNEWLVKSQAGVDAIVGANRGIASFEEMGSVESIQWEHELAQKLSQEKSTAKSLLAAKPTLKDELVFGFLEGKYRTHLSGNKIQSFEFLDQRNSDQPLVIKQKEEFLKIFKSVFSVSYAKVELDKKEATLEVYKLIGPSSQAIGQAHFVLDEQGRVLSLKIQ
ncbi:MAG: hypothetical protein IPM97_03620 [Bdellovibrionaceae bacterium]|nr:hypothetical protein [Pseudobdellovibrionaceae bacterium]